MTGTPTIALTPRLAWLYARRPVAYYQQIAAYGHTVRTWTPFGRGVLTGDPAVVADLFAATAIGPMDGIKLQDFFGAASPIVVGGSAHQRTRRQLRRPMTSLDGVARIATEETAREFATWPHEDVFPLLPSIRRIALRVILRALGGKDAICLVEAATRWVDTITPALAALPALRVRLGGLSAWDRHLAARARLEHELLALMALRDRGENRGDILSGLLATTDDTGKVMTDRWVLDQLLSLIFAGHETSAVTMAWTLAWLLRSPEALREAVAEASAGRSTVYIHVGIDEAMRISPLGDLPARVAIEDMRLGSVDVRRGEAIVVAPWILHHRPDLWPEPSAYRPERFLNATAPTNAFVPFGGGSRRCLGAQFALQEMPAVLQTILASVSLELVSVPELRRIGLVIGPSDGVLVRRTGGTHARA